MSINNFSVTGNNQICHLPLNNPIKVGMFKIHPKVPECMSDEAKGFIMNCFVPNPDDRATAAELLGDTFLRSSPKKKAKALQELDPKDSLSGSKHSLEFQAQITVLVMYFT